MEKLGDSPSHMAMDLDNEELLLNSPDPEYYLNAFETSANNGTAAAVQALYVDLDNQSLTETYTNHPQDNTEEARANEVMISQNVSDETNGSDEAYVVDKETYHKFMEFQRREQERRNEEYRREFSRPVTQTLNATYDENNRYRTYPQAARGTEIPAQPSGHQQQVHTNLTRESFTVNR